MRESTKIINEMSAYDIDIMTDAINHIAQEQLVSTEAELRQFLSMLCDKYGSSPIVAFADYVRNN